MAKTSHHLCCALLLLAGLADTWAGEQRSCPLPDGSSFEFDGRHGGFHPGKALMFHSTTPDDPYRWAFKVQYRHRDGRLTELPFRDDWPHCERYGRVGTTLFASSAQGMQKKGQGQWSAYWLVISEDDGRSFSDNLHPYRERTAWAAEAHERALAREPRFGKEGGDYLLELGGPTAYERFLLFRSGDQGRHWAAPEIREEPQVFDTAEVARARDSAALSRWVDLKYQAVQQACAQARQAKDCGRATTQQAEARWDECRQRQRPLACLRELKAPAVIVEPPPP